MKRLLSIIICMTFVTGSIVYAKKDSTENVLSAIKSRIPDTEPYEDFNAYTHETGEDTSYRFEWNSTSDNDYKHMSITVDENNIITSLYQYSKGMYETGTSPVDMPSSDDMLPKAKQLCDALNPGLSGKYAVEKISHTDNISSDSFSFRLQRYENNIPVQNDAGNVQISLDGSKILSYDIRYTADAKFEPADNLIDPDTAKNAFGEKLGLNLKYRIKRVYKEKTQTPYIVYEVTDKYGKYINAVTGAVTEPVTEDFYGRYMLNSKQEESADMSTAMTAGGSLTEAEISEINYLSSLKTKEELLDIIKSYPFLSYANELTCTGFRTSADPYSGKYYGTFNFTSESEDEYENLYVTIDRSNGMIKSFSHYKNTDKKADTVPENAKDTAIAAAKLLAGELFDEYRLKDSDDKTVSFVFNRYINNIEVEGDTISVSVDNDGNVSYYNIEYTDEDFLSTDNIITSENALKKLFEYTPYSVYYINSSENYYTPAYILSNSSLYIDAFTGKQLDYAGEEYIEETIGNYTDISGHWAEDIIKTLSRFGIGVAENEFLPDTKIKQKEFLTLLNSIYGGYEPVIGAKTDYDSIYKIIQNRGIIDESEISPDEPLTRDTAAILLIRCMGAEKYAKLDNIYSCPFNDVTENKGYICILYGLKIISGNTDGNFYPKTELTRAEASAMIYNYLKTMK